jgi:hypothetical protein
VAGWLMILVNDRNIFHLFAFKIEIVTVNVMNDRRR